jgi:processive 1,2-diacylglycerol beta-glucosyltransferase
MIDLAQVLLLSCRIPNLRCLLNEDFLSMSKMDEWMAASDLLIGKPGGLTTSEALARGLPMLIVNPIPGQEERNADHLLEWGCAVRCNNLATLDHKFGQLLKGDRLRIMSEKCRQYARPSAAEMIGKIAGF